ncbi:MAG TPA: putative quinol monooxygenase [Microbacteriaceae bacterium]|nr:putative quinol monooxygenase [Microbacteriaceae bacterium]
MSEVVVMIVRAVPQPGQTQAVLEVLQELVPIVHDEPGCELYSLHVHDDGDIYFIEKWASAELAQQHGQSSPILPALAERASPLLQGPPEITVLTPAPAGGAKGAL